LGQPAKDFLLEHPRSQGIDLEDGLRRTLNQLNAALAPFFTKQATAIIMEMIRNHVYG